MSKLILIFLLLGLTTQARGSGGVIATDKVAHVGTAFALQTVGYGILKNKGFDKTDSLILSGLATFGVGLLWEAFGPTPLSKGDILANTIGQAASIGTILSFEF